MKSFDASNAYVSAVHDVIPGGAHTYAKGDDQYPDGMAPVIERGAGCRVWDIDGNEYVEFGSGLRSNLLGWRTVSTSSGRTGSNVRQRNA